MSSTEEPSAEDEVLLAHVADVLREGPPPIDGAAVRMLVRQAIREADDDALADAFAGAIAAHEPPAAERDIARRAIDRAKIVPLPTGRARMPWAWAAAATVVFAIGAGLWAQLLFDERPPSAPVAHRLEGGHVVTASGGARLRFDERESRVRATLDSGEALFDVVRGSDFVVRAGDVVVRVTGTVFTVSRDGEHVVVRVYEGSVRVDAEGRRVDLAAGESWSQHGAAARSQLHAAAERAAAHRAARAALERPPGAREEAPAAEQPVSSDPPAARHPRPAPPSIDGAQRALVEARYADALALADRALRLGPSFEWAMTRADALRGLARHDDAVDAYRSAMEGATPDQRALAGLSGARVLAARQRSDRARALLEESGALAESSPVRAAAVRLDAQLGAR
jgi:tetratricopeptide (TPR) repeat protein